MIPSIILKQLPSSETETGCGKTTVVQLLSILMQRRLHAINCHATTETSDILGGLRPVRGREGIVWKMATRLCELLDLLTDMDSAVRKVEIPDFIAAIRESSQSPVATDTEFPPNAAEVIVSFTKSLRESWRAAEEGLVCSEKKAQKRRKLKDTGAFTPGTSSVSSKEVSALQPLQHDSTGGQSKIYESFEALVRDIEALFQKYSSIFEWADGPLVTAMRDGQLLLLDEMSLADDAVLERLNSVLEPSRRIVLAEKGGEGVEVGDVEVKAHDHFLIFATMNPGGDFGKRELSPALRSRFTEIWVPPIRNQKDIDLVLERALVSATGRRAAAEGSQCTPILHDIDNIRSKMLEYVNFFNTVLCGSGPSSQSIGISCADLQLSLRDILSWAKFIVDVCHSGDDKADVDKYENAGIDLWSGYIHGAALTHLDGLGLGTGLSREDVTRAKKLASTFLGEQIASIGNGHSSAEEYLCGSKSIARSEFSVNLDSNTFGAPPFFIPVGSNSIPEHLGFNFNAPTTGMNVTRVLRAMQLKKPILLEGSPGVGKTR